MKRVGKRGEGKWQRISFEQLIEEVVEGGDLFGEGHVDGLRAIHAPDTPIDAKHPSFGPKTNQLLVTNTSDEGRDAFLRRFALNSFGSKNFGAHGAYCGLAYRAGSGALMGDLDKNPHVKPDWENVEFALFMGTSRHSPAIRLNARRVSWRAPGCVRIFNTSWSPPPSPYQRCSPILAVAGNRSCPAAIRRWQWG